MFTRTCFVPQFTQIKNICESWVAARSPHPQQQHLGPLLPGIFQGPSPMSHGSRDHPLPCSQPRYHPLQRNSSNCSPSPGDRGLDTLRAQQWWGLLEASYHPCHCHSVAVVCPPVSQQSELMGVHQVPVTHLCVAGTQSWINRAARELHEPLNSLQGEFSLYSLNSLTACECQRSWPYFFKF